MFLRSNTRIKDGKQHRYYTVVESRRLQSGKVAQRQVLYLGEINDSQQAAWRKTLEVFDEGQQRYRPLSLFPEDRPVPADAIDGVQVKLSEMKLERARPYGNCWLGCELWRQLQLDRFWSGKLPRGRESVAWPQVLELLVVNRLIDPGSEFHLHRQWFDHSAMDVLLGQDFAVAEKDRLYRCLDRVLEHKQDLFVHLQQRWKDLFDAEFDLLLYDLTSTYVEGEAEQNPKARYGYSRDKRPDCKQVVIALIVTPAGLPLAYEVMAGNTSEKTTLRDFLDRIENLYGKARRVWLMDRGIPTEALLREMRTSRQETFYLVGTSRAKIREYEKQWLELPWQKVRESVEVKLFAREGELYVLAKSERAAGQRDGDAAEKTGAAAAEVARDAAELSEAGSVADARGRRQNGCGTGFRICENQPTSGGPGSDARDVHVSTRQGQAERGRTARRPLSAADEPDGGRSGRVVGSLRATDADRSGVQMPEE